MQVSKVLGNVQAKPVTVGTFEELESLFTKSTYSLSTFKNNRRSIDNFEKTNCIGLDIDAGMTLEQAEQSFKNMRHLIMPTKSHQKEKVLKSGETLPACDRFRVILFLSKPITDAETYYATWQAIANIYPAIDPACKDPSRQFYKSTHVHSKQTDGGTIDPVSPAVKTVTVQPKQVVAGAKGELSKRTLKFLLEGARKGERHGELYFAARDFHEQGYSIEECRIKIGEMIGRDPDWSFNKNDEATIEDAYTREAKHEPRNVTPKAFSFKTMGEVFEAKATLDWYVEDLLTVGGFSVVAGPPKSGKSTIVRQLAVATAQGADFLGRKVKQGPVLYLALEEQEEMLHADFKKLGAKSTDPILVHVGGAMGGNVDHDLAEAVDQLKPVLTVIDTFALYAGVKSMDNYGEVNQPLSRLRKVARDSRSHVLIIHHSRKGAHGAGSILGSQAIHGAVDCAISFNQQGNTRFISTSQRGGRPISNVEAVFDSKTNLYRLGKLYEPQDEF